jgi:hypothetical protein
MREAPFGDGFAAREIVRRPLVVVGKERQPLTPGQRDGGVPGPADPAIPIEPDDPKPAIADPAEDLGRGVGRAVVHDEDLDVLEGLGSTLAIARPTR